MLSLTNGDNHIRVIEDVIANRQITIKVKLNTQKFQFLKLLLNDEEICVDQTLSNDGSNIMIKTVTFKPSNDEIAEFKDHFKVNYNADRCGELELIKTWSLGSERADWRYFPWVVKIFKNSVLHCTGSLISKSVVLTAGHCFEKGNISHKQFHVEVINDRRISTWGYLLHKNQKDHVDDIALLYLAEDVSEANFIPICLATQVPANSSGLLVSFGDTELGLSGRLHELPMEAVSNGNCRATNAKLANKLENSHFCGRAPEDTGPCQGDSGAGLIFKYNGRWHLYGILSASLVEDKDSTCDVENNSIFIDILFYLNWIPKGSETPKIPTRRPPFFPEDPITGKPPTRQPPTRKPPTRRPPIGSGYPTEPSFVQTFRGPPPRRASDEFED